MRFQRPFRRTIGGFGLALLVTAVGCNSSDNPPIAKVKGTVTFSGKPVPNLMVNFMPAADGKQGRPSWGKTDSAGKYEMNYDTDNMGVMVGRHKVFFSPGAATIDGASTKKSQDEAAAGSGLTGEDLRKILATYGDPATTKLEVDVQKDNLALDLKLE